MLNKSQYIRYSRQLILDDFDEKKQLKLLKSKVLIAGAGGLGSSAILYLAAAGIGTIGVIDFDVVNLSDLNRQIIHNYGDINSKKVDSAFRRIKALNKDIKVNRYDFKINSSNIANILDLYDIVVECSDNLSTKLLINDICYFIKKPFIVGGVSGFDGTVVFITPEKSSCCLRCFYLSNIEDIDFSHRKIEPIPVIGMIPGIIGTVQALEVVKFILNIGEVLVNKIFYFSGTDLSTKIVELKKNKDCKLCGYNPVIDKELFKL